MEPTDSSTFEWQCNPSRLYPVKRVIAWVCIVGFGASIIATDLIMGVLLTAVLLGSLSSSLFTSRFSINAQGVFARYPLRSKFYAWDQIRRVKTFQHVGYLFKRKKPSNLDGWIGLSLYFGAQREEIMEAMNTHLTKDVVR